MDFNFLKKRGLKCHFMHFTKVMSEGFAKLHEDMDKLRHEFKEDLDSVKGTIKDIEESLNSTQEDVES